MAPYYESAKSFAEVLITEDGVDTAGFLQASDDFLHMFDLVGSNVFAFIQTDLRNNLEGIRHRYETTEKESHTLERLVKQEVKEGQHYATACVTRLIRGLLFACRALQIMQADRDADLHVCFKRSYDEILKHQHSFVVRSVVTVAIRAVPHREYFYDCLTEGTNHEKFDRELTGWLAGLDVIVTHMKSFLEHGGYGKV